MSTLQVGNVHLESTANNRVQYVGTNTVHFVAAGVTTAIANSSQFNIPSTTQFTVSGAAAGSMGTLTDGANVAVDLTTYNSFTLTLGGNRNIDNPTTLANGQSGVIYLVQDNTASRTLTWSANWKFKNGDAPTLSTGANDVDVVSYSVRTPTSITAIFTANVG